MSDHPLPPMLTVVQACELLGCGRRTLTRMMHDGAIRWSKLGRGRSAPIRIVRDSLLAAVGLESRSGQQRRHSAAEAEYHQAMAAIRRKR